MDSGCRCNVLILPEKLLTHALSLLLYEAHRENLCISEHPNFFTVWQAETTHCILKGGLKLQISLNGFLCGEEREV